MPHASTLYVKHWLKRVVSTALLAGGCLAGLGLLYGGNTGSSAALVEASHLTDVETSELVGTNNYQQPSTPIAHNLWTAVGQTFSLPFMQPAHMLASEVPISSTTSQTDTQGQTNLIGTISNFAKKTNKINMGWIQLSSPQASIQMMQDNPEINTISPGWYTVNNSGKLTDNAQPSVISYAHAHGKKVWVMLDNQFSSSLTHRVVSNAHLRDQLVSEVAAAVKRNGVDGVNIDFENMDSNDEANFTEFVAGLHQALEPLHAKVSVDITTDIVFLADDAAYFHAGLAAACDYVVLMAYDEHWSDDPTPGPVADVPWVTKGVNDLLDTGVPADKIILGLPLYARFWHVYSNGSVSSEAIADPNIGTILAKYHAKTSWNNALGVAYAKYPKSDGYEEAWYETINTLNRKLSLVQGDDLAGISVWSLNLSSAQTWSNVMQALRQSLS